MAAGEPLNALGIGEVSRRSRLPISTLRYYHEIGLLVPASVDPATNYRSYSPEQVADAVLIHELRRAGLDPAQMARVLAADRERLVDEVRAVTTTVRQRLESEAARLDRLDAFVVRHLRETEEESPLLVGDVPQPIVWLDRTVRTDALTVDLKRAFAELRRQDAYRAGVFGARFPLDFDSDTMTVRVFVDDGSPVGRGAIAVSLRRRGPYDDLWRAYAALLDDVEDRGWRPIGHVVERYLPATGAEPVTEVTLPIQVANKP